MPDAEAVRKADGSRTASGGDHAGSMPVKVSMTLPPEARKKTVL